MILGIAGRLADSQQVNEFLEFAEVRSIDLNEMWIAAAGERLLWAILPIPSAGRTVLLFMPGEAGPGDTAAALAMLLEKVCALFAQRNTQLAQVLLEPGDVQTRRVMEAHGFERMAELLYLNAAIRRPLPPPPLPNQYLLLNYSEQTHALFAEAILASYQQSLDCPRLNGVRTIDDIIAGHKASGEFDPAHWFVLCEQSQEKRQAVGVLLLSRLSRGDSTELIYLGLAPSARGKHLGEWLMRRVFVAAAEMGSVKVNLAVDSANAPALKLYYRFGMSRLGSKIAMMRNLGI